MKKTSLKKLTRKNWKSVDQKVEEILAGCKDNAKAGLSYYKVTLNDINPANYEKVWLMLEEEYGLNHTGWITRFDHSSAILDWS